MMFLIQNLTRFISLDNFALFSRRGRTGRHGPAFRSTEEGGQGAGGRVAVEGGGLGGRHEVIEHLPFSFSSFNVNFLRVIIVLNVLSRVMFGSLNNSCRRSYRVIQRSSPLSSSRGTEVNTSRSRSFVTIPCSTQCGGRGSRGDQEQFGVSRTGS